MKYKKIDIVRIKSISIENNDPGLWGVWIDLGGYNLFRLGEENIGPAICDIMRLCGKQTMYDCIDMPLELTFEWDDKGECYGHITKLRQLPCDGKRELDVSHWR